MSDPQDPGALEDPVLVFFSHVMDPTVDDIVAEVHAVQEAVRSEADYRLWTFEQHPASGVDPSEAWRIGIRRSEYVLVLIGSEVTPAVEAEVAHALELDRWTLVFVRTMSTGRGKRAAGLLETIRRRVTYAEFESPQELQHEVQRALRHSTRSLTRQGLLATRGQTLSAPGWRHQGEMTIVDALGSSPDRMFRDGPEEQLEQRHAAGRDLLNRGRFSTALNLYQVLVDDPVLANYPARRAKALNNLSLAARALGRRDLALTASTEATRLLPTDRVLRLTHLGNLTYFREEGWRETVNSVSGELKGDASGLQLLGAIAIDDGDHVAAIDYCRRALEASPNDHAALLNLGHSLAKTGRLGDALSVLSTIPADSFYFIPAQVRRAELLYEQAKSSQRPKPLLMEAEHTLRRASDVAMAQALDAADWAEAKLHASMCQAGVLILSGRAADAVGILQGLESEIPERSRFLANIAQAYSAAGQIDAAVNALEEAHRIEVSDPEVVNWLAALLLDRFNKNGNIADVQRAEELLVELLTRGASGIAVLNLTQLFLGSNRLESAEQLVANARAVLPEDMNVHVAELAIAMKRRDLRTTLQIAGAIHSKDRTEVTAATVLGLHEYREGRFAEAILRLQDAISDPFCRTVVHVDAYIYLARALRRTERIAEALEVAVEGSRRYPDVPAMTRLCEEIASKGLS